MNKGNLLIVDDEVKILKNLKLLLAEYVDEIFLAENGIEALQQLKNHEIHCVICDINMPRMNGVDVIKNIRKSGNEVPFIFYTGHGNHDLMMEAVKYGAFDFLNKPNLDGLEEVVSRGLQEGFERRQGQSPTTETYISEYQEILRNLKK